MDNPALQPLVWIDAETTGLNPDADCMLELAIVVTGPDLVPLAPPFSTVIAPCSADALARMDDWVHEAHTASGLLAEAASGPGVGEVEARALGYLMGHVLPKTAPLAGSSVGFDRSFLVRHMPLVAAHLHYRTVDVSSVRELARRWYPEAAAARPSGKSPHRALPDILASIEELAYWRRTVFAAPVPATV